MRKLLFLLLSIIILSSCNNTTEGDSEQPADGVAEITFKSMQHDFGKIEEGEQVACVFPFKNTGTADLIIASATTSCGCTVPDYPQDPIKVGGEGRIEVVFDSSFRKGLQSKTITLRTNAAKPVVILKITAEIEPNNIID